LVRFARRSGCAWCFPTVSTLPRFAVCGGACLPCPRITVLAIPTNGMAILMN
jgi:hypothetical protein